MAQNGISWTVKNAVWIFAIGFVVTFFYIWGVVQPPLIFQHQQPTFFYGADYFAKLMQHPGGFVDYLSNFLTQFYSISFLGAFIITLTVFGIGFSALKIFKLFNLGLLAPLLALLLMGFLIAAHSNYFYTLAPSLSTLLTLAVFLFYSTVTPKHFVLRVILFSFIARTLYVFVAAPFLLFILLSLVAELFIMKENRVKKIIAAVIFSSSIFWPLLVHKYIFLFSSKDIYTYLLPVESVSDFHIFAKIAWAILCLSPIVGVVLNLFKTNALNTLSFNPIKEIIAVCVIFIAVGVVAYNAFNEKHKIVLKIDRYAEHQQWQEVLKTATENEDVLHRLITLHYDRALYHTGQLLDNLFSYPQIEGEKGLIRNSGPAFESPFANADLMFEMGNINSAQIWANEALSIEGQSPRILKLLVLIHLYKNELEAAEIYLNKVSKTVGNKEWAEHYKQLLKEPLLIKNDPAFNIVDGHTINENFFIRFGQMYAELKMFYDNSVPSRMAFEYLFAYNLLSRRLDFVAAMAPHILDLPYPRLPRHVEEVLILIGMSGSDFNVDLNAFDFQPSRVEDFKTFMSIIAKHNNNLQYAQAELLQTFGDTYWYYHIYHQGQELK